MYRKQIIQIVVCYVLGSISLGFALLINKSLITIAFSEIIVDGLVILALISFIALLHAIYKVLLTNRKIYLFLRSMEIVFIIGGIIMSIQLIHKYFT